MLYQAQLTRTATQSQINAVLTSAQQVMANFNNSGVSEQWRSDGSSTSGDIFQNITPQLISKTTQVTQFTIPQITQPQITSDLNYVQDQGVGTSGYNWIYDQVYNTGGLSSTMNTWGYAAQNLTAAAGQVYCSDQGVKGDLNLVASALQNLGGVLTLFSPNGSYANEVGQAMLTAAGGLKTLLSICL